MDSEKKRIHLHPPVDDLEFDFKVNRAIQFLGDKHSVQVIVHVLETENGKNGMGHNVLKKFVAQIGNNGVSSRLVPNGTELACVISPST